MYGFQHFKGFVDARLQLAGPFTLLIGRNGSGKSNAIEGIELLAQLAAGRPLHDVTELGRGGALEVRGGLVGCARRGAESFRLTYLEADVPDDRSERLEYSVEIGTRGEPRVVAESLHLGERTLFEVVTGSNGGRGGSVKVRYDTFARGRNKPTDTLTADRAVLPRYETFANGPKQREARARVDDLRKRLGAVHVFDPVPARMRQYERPGARQLQRNGANLSAVLFALSKGDPTDRRSLRHILEAIRQVPEEPFARFGFVETPLHDVLFELQSARGARSVDARLLSDGTLRCLAVLTAVETAPPGARVVVEEFDNGLHPSRTGGLTQALRDSAKRRGVNVLVTTHNPATLDALPADQLDCVRLAYAHPRTGAAHIVPLRDIPRADVMLDGARLGDLVSRLVLDRHLRPGFEREVGENFVRWLETAP